jgi:hypothetical protein
VVRAKPIVTQEMTAVIDSRSGSYGDSSSGNEVMKAASDEREEEGKEKLAPAPNFKPLPAVKKATERKSINAHRTLPRAVTAPTPNIVAKPKTLTRKVRRTSFRP